MEKKNRILFVITGGIILLVVLSLGMFYLGMKYAQNNQKEQNPSTSEKDKVIKPQLEYEVTLNSQKKNIQVQFKTEKVDSTHSRITGTINGHDVYSEDVEAIDLDTSQMMDKVNKHFTKDNIMTIKGTDDKDYLIVRNYSENLIRFDIFDDQLKVINRENEFIYLYKNQYIETIDDSNPWYDDKYNLCTENDCHIRTKIESDKIYNFQYEYLNGDFSKMEERIYTIKNGKLEYTTIETYSVTGSGVIF